MSTFKFEGKTQEEKSADYEKADAHLDVLLNIDRLEAEKAEVEKSIKDLEGQLEAFDKLEEKKNSLLKKTDGMEIDHALLNNRKKLPRVEVSDVAYDAPDKTKLDSDFDKAFNDALEIEDETVEDEKKRASEHISESEKEIEQLTEELKKRDAVQAKYYRLRKKAKKIASDLESAQAIADKNDAEQKTKTAAPEAPVQNEVNIEPVASAAGTSPEANVSEKENKTSPASAESAPATSEDRTGNARDKMIEGDIYDVRSVKYIDRNSELYKSIRNQIRQAGTFPELWTALERTRGYMAHTPEELKNIYIKVFRDNESLSSLPEEFEIRFKALDPFLPREAERYFSESTETKSQPEAPQTTPEKTESEKEKTPKDASVSKLIKDTERPSPETSKGTFGWLWDWVHGVDKTAKKESKKRAKKSSKREPQIRIEPRFTEIIDNPDIPREPEKKNEKEEESLRKLDEIIDEVNASVELKKAYDYLVGLTLPLEPHHAAADAHILKSIVEKYDSSEALKRIVFEEQRKEALEPKLLMAVNKLQQKMYGAGTSKWRFSDIEAEKIEKNGAPVTRAEITAENTEDNKTEKTKEAEAEASLSFEDRAKMINGRMKGDEEFAQIFDEVTQKFGGMANPKKYPQRLASELDALFSREQKPTKVKFNKMMGIKDLEDGSRKDILNDIAVILFGKEADIKEMEKKRKGKEYY